MRNHKCQDIPWNAMMTSSNGNIFRVTGPLWGKSTGDRCIPLTKASDTELWCFLWSMPEQAAEQTIEKLVIWTPSSPLWRHDNTLFIKFPDNRFTWQLHVPRTLAGWKLCMQTTSILHTLLHLKNPLVYHLQQQQYLFQWNALKYAEIDSYHYLTKKSLCIKSMVSRFHREGKTSWRTSDWPPWSPNDGKFHEL